VQAVRVAMQRLGLESLLAARPSRERALVRAMVAARIIAPHTKLATTRWWHTTTLAEDFGVQEASENDLYAAMDWLLSRQEAIQKKLAARHLGAGSLVLYDLSSSYFEGTTCPLAKLGYNRDGKNGLLQVNYGVLTDACGCPVAVSVYEGNVADSQTLLPELKRLREHFRHRAAGDGRRPRHGLQPRHRHHAGNARRGLDHRLEECVHPRARRARAPATGSVR
jgi:hypothetical protein